MIDGVDMLEDVVGVCWNVAKGCKLVEGCEVGEEVRLVNVVK